ncbi:MULTISPECIES: hypothetical protein [unclassified Streptomyces]|uniref:hypothetical protein n=1 Tax=unclassified Streptomyces TaxID=2593676 RepID=UPI003255A35E
MTYSEADRQRLMRQTLDNFARRSDEGLDNFLAHVRHRLEAARHMGVEIPEDLATRVERLSLQRGWSARWSMP